MDKFIKIIALSLPALTVLLILIVVLLAIHVLFRKRYADIPGFRFRQQIIYSLVVVSSIIIFIIVLPINDTLRDQLLGLAGLLLSAVIALSSTTFMGNAMAGIMLRTIRSFKGGDFLKTENHFGRVSEMGLFHVEIQTEDSDLTTLPNLYLVTTPYTVIRSSETIVSAEVSLGYDIHHNKISPLLKKAALSSGLSEPFVHIVQLGDFSITYKIGGLLQESKHLISIRSKLREKILDSLHEANIEIVSPNFENARAIKEGEFFIPEPVREDTSEKQEAASEEIVFEKADLAENIEKLKEALEENKRKIQEIEAQAGDTADQGRRKQLEKQLAILNKQKEKLEKLSQMKEMQQEEEQS